MNEWMLFCDDDVKYDTYVELLSQYGMNGDELVWCSLGKNIRNIE